MRRSPQPQFGLWVRLAASALTLSLPMILGTALFAEVQSTSADELAAREIFGRRCGECHGGRSGPVKGGLNLLSIEGILEGGHSGPVLVEGDPAQSLILHAIEQVDPDLKMPPKGPPLTPEEIEVVRRWIATGVSAQAQTREAARKRHWAFEPISEVVPPEVQNESWVKTDLDRFVLASLEGKGLSPNPPAEERVLARRLSLLLHGLLPEQDRVDQYRHGGEMDWVAFVDDLLASPHFGEQFARLWLDVARYADTKGDPSNRDDARFPFAWTYRDYVVGAFNADKPFDRFITEQLAADLIEDEAEKATILPALGFLTLGNQFDGRQRDIIDDQIDTTSKAFLGLGVSCARCHNHKFDPIPTEDYYSFFGIFANSHVPEKLPEVGSPTMPSLAGDYHEQAGELQKEVERIPEILQHIRAVRAHSPGKARELAGAERARQRDLFKRIGTLDSMHLGSPIRAQVLNDVAEPKDFPVLVRGEPDNLGATVPRRFLRVLSLQPDHRPSFTSGSGRLDLAKAIVDPANPLPARVMVNRIWQHLWGVGFVSTPDDFGQAAEAPTDGPLLDFLARKFMNSGWSVKELVKQIVLSATFQQSSQLTLTALLIDPKNELRWHYPQRRLRAEEIYDSLLQVGGGLDRSMGGRPVRDMGTSIPSRRAIYAWIDRRGPPDFLLEFDFPAPEVTTGSRATTTSPQQALFFMNSPLVHEVARRVVQNRSLSTQPEEAGITDCFSHLLGRAPQSEEVFLVEHFLSSAGNPTASSSETWAKIVHALLQSEEFISLY